MISPIECEHDYTYPLDSRRIVSLVEYSECRVYLCKNCGKFFIRGHQNGEHFQFSFYLVREEHLEAASKPVKYFGQDD